MVDNLNKECFQIAIEIGDDADRREWAMTMILVARALERIGDNAVDIGEQIAYVVTGLFREFEDASHPEQSPLDRARAVARRGSDGADQERRVLAQLRRPRPVRRVHLEDDRRAGAPTISGPIACQGSVPRPGGRCRSRRSGSTPRASPCAVAAAGAEVVVGVEQRHRRRAPAR